MKVLKGIVGFVMCEASNTSMACKSSCGMLIGSFQLQL